jgi:uncharacterized PurR-regulated membrane protein YhhQ (DUF165 family)
MGDPGAQGDNVALRLALFAAFVAVVYGANWALDRYGVVSIGFGLMAPAGVYFAGVGFGLRDALHEAGGRSWVLGAIATGAARSWWLSDAVTIPGGHTSIAVASGVAFGLSELADLAVYAPLRNRKWPVAVVLSNVVGSVADSALFLWLAFGSLDLIEGQVIGKTYMVAVALPLVWLARTRRWATV